MKSISRHDIRKVILDFLEQRFANNSNYKSEQAKLEKAKKMGNLSAINQSEQKLAELAKKYDFETWMEDAATRRIFWISMGTNLSKGIHSSSLGDNVNYSIQTKPTDQSYVSSATPLTLPLDCSGNAAALDIFSLVNQKVKGDVTLLQLIVNDHPEILAALSDDKQKASLYLANFKKAIFDDFEYSKASDLNKQFFWPNSQKVYLSSKEKNYRLLIPLHPSSLCHLVFQKIQTRFSEENKNAREQRRIKDAEHESYFSFHHLAVVKLGGSNPQGVSQLTSNQGGRNFLLPSMPPKFNRTPYPSISNYQETIFNKTLQYYCQFGFNLLFEMIKTANHIEDAGDNRKDALAVILTLILKFAWHIQTTMPEGWSRGYSLNLTQQLWLDPKRTKLAGETEFKRKYEQGHWQQELEQQFAFWVHSILKERFENVTQQLSDLELGQWRSEFSIAVNASKRIKEEVV